MQHVMLDARPELEPLKAAIAALREARIDWVVVTFEGATRIEKIGTPEFYRDGIAVPLEGWVEEDDLTPVLRKGQDGKPSAHELIEEAFAHYIDVHGDDWYGEDGVEGQLMLDVRQPKRPRVKVSVQARHIVLFDVCTEEIELEEANDQVA